ncbi:MAG: HAMP domain-containing histidine kinase [Saprospiraceae bacterium]|nr:HAMP domain-containing histidine kinase [Saprospiraceae bacterium]
MEIYRSKSAWKLYAMVVGVVIIVALVIAYSSILANNLKASERERVELLAKAYEDLFKDPDLERDVTLATEIIEANKTIPVILVNPETNEILQWQNFPDAKNELIIQKELDKIIEDGDNGIVFEYLDLRYAIYYKGSDLNAYITYFPYFILLVLLSFMAIGYVSVTSARQAEQNRVWVGMAKETAHQLGTPISAIVAWIEHLKVMSEENPDNLEIISELENDVGRLDLIADRFSKIGSAPKLEGKNVIEELQKTGQYMQRRASRKVRFEFPDSQSEAVYANINAPLFNWVIENLLRNALDAMDGEGLIKAQVHSENKTLQIDITDSGKGIPSSKQKLVFKPGFTTKKRGWGLGLSLAKRIIEEYHGGKIYVSKSEPNVGTTFTIKLPLGVKPDHAAQSEENLLEAKSQR